MCFKRAILTHGGANSDPKDSSGTAEAAKIGMDLMKKGDTVLSAAVQAVRYLESDPRFNAGHGSQLRNDERTIQLDASCMTSSGQFGAVACVEGILNPIDLAYGVLVYSPHILIAGRGAHLFAKKHNIKTISSIKLEKRNRPRKDPKDCCDTVGGITFDGKEFSAALSSGGTEKAAVGRVGDVPLPGCGLFCGSEGAIACTGDGDFIALKILAREVYGWLKKKVSPNEATKKVIKMFPYSTDIGIIILTKDKFAARARNNMAWSYLTEG